MVVRRFNYYRFFVFVVVLSVIIFTTYKLISNYKYKQTYEYKLSLVGYKEDEITTIKNKLSDSEIDKLLELINSISTWIVLLVSVVSSSPKTLSKSLINSYLVKSLVLAFNTSYITLIALAVLISSSK